MFCNSNSSSNNNSSLIDDEKMTSSFLLSGSVCGQSHGSRQHTKHP